MTDTVLVDTADRVMVITINRPQAKNAIDSSVAAGIAAAIDDLESRDDLTAAIGELPILLGPSFENDKKEAWLLAFKGDVLAPRMALVETVRFLLHCIISRSVYLAQARYFASRTSVKDRRDGTILPS